MRLLPPMVRSMAPLDLMARVSAAHAMHAAPLDLVICPVPVAHAVIICARSKARFK